MEYTENLGLRKPLPTELYDVGDFNYNADVLDAKFKEHDDLLDEYGDLPDNLSEVEEKADTAMSIAKGRNQAHVFSTTQAMQTWLSVADNKGLYQVGDNLYIVDVGVPDWWISEVLDTADAETGYYYKIAQLETQKVDLTDIEAELATLNEDLENQSSILENKAPKSHASSDTTYGIGTTSIYGHCKLANNLTTSAYANGVALSAYQGKLLNDKIANLITPVYVGSMVKQVDSEASGELSIAFSEVGISSRPSVVLAIPQSFYGFMDYIFEESSYIRLVAFGVNGTSIAPITAGISVRFGIVVFK